MWKLLLRLLNEIKKILINIWAQYTVAIKSVSHIVTSEFAFKAKSLAIAFLIFFFFCPS